MDSNYRPGLNWPVTSSGTGFSESSKACTSLPLSLFLHLPLRVLSLSSFFPETLSRNFTLSIRIFHQKLIPIISSFSLLFFFCSFILRLHFELLRASCSFRSPFFRKSRAKVMSIPSCRRVNVWNKSHEISKSSSGQWKFNSWIYSWSIVV